jgi:hypothetical protein
MPKLPSLLPQLLSRKGSWKKILNTLYRVFERDFKQHTTKHESFPVDFTRKILPDGEGKEEGFWHVVSKYNKTSGDRLIDFDRAKRLPWARPMMENPAISEIKVFDYDHGYKDKGVRRYIWLEDFDYVLVLKKYKKKYIWITAYYVYKSGKIDLGRRYKNRVTT